MFLFSRFLTFDLPACRFIRTLVITLGLPCFLLSVSVLSKFQTLTPAEPSAFSPRRFSTPLPPTLVRSRHDFFGPALARNSWAGHFPQLHVGCTVASPSGLLISSGFFFQSRSPGVTSGTLVTWMSPHCSSDHLWNLVKVMMPR